MMMKVLTNGTANDLPISFIYLLVINILNYKSTSKGPMLLYGHYFIVVITCVYCREIARKLVYNP